MVIIILLKVPKGTFFIYTFTKRAFSYEKIILTIKIFIILGDC